MVPLPAAELQGLLWEALCPVLAAWPPWGTITHSPEPAPRGRESQSGGWAGLGVSHGHQSQGESGPRGQQQLKASFLPWHFTGLQKIVWRLSSL